MTQGPDLAGTVSVRSKSSDATVILNEVSVFYGEVVGLSQVTLALTRCRVPRDCWAQREWKDHHDAGAHGVAGST